MSPAPGVSVATKGVDELREVVGKRRFELERPIVIWMSELQPRRVEGLSFEIDRPKRLRSVHITLFPHERVTP